MLNAIFPGLGYDWDELLNGSTAMLFAHMAIYTRQWEAVVARWAEGDHTLLQPAEPCWFHMLAAVIANMWQTSLAKELELCDSPLSLASTLPDERVKSIYGCQKISTCELTHVIH